ncbi:TPA: hypothetical protein QDC20_002693 [Burkholderia aenigmatica]|uniref:hypothetical protein n=1 Tax=Burkholderia sp. AU45251 TaxID=3059204 RepID=UPI0026534CE7|nr:hypothetical protein [Burkholderia sp. AU45251]HDR9484453.1 hypothetical protein [Burkholderia aenigmatica]MDN7516952.1 hypothetical protein [Burkholderia sp. AU45251]HDR9515729.1 hypothetical protein [Burkholderia aenigmatica]HDR9592538.1 hypothetical protein [Burkholderia aenigmatica]HDR9599518.1 hypothetical protein [Burkholderia aenigmatica]
MATQQTPKKDIERWHAIAFMAMVLVPMLTAFVTLPLTWHCTVGDWPGASRIRIASAIAFALLGVHITRDLGTKRSIKELLIAVVMFGGLGMISGSLSLLLLVRATAHSPQSFDAAFVPGAHQTKGCGYRITFADPGLGSPALVCNRDLDLPDGAVSGVVRVNELVGPYGVRHLDMTVVESTVTGSGK